MKYSYCLCFVMHSPPHKYDFLLLRLLNAANGQLHQVVWYSVIWNHLCKTVCTWFLLGVRLYAWPIWYGLASPYFTDFAFCVLFFPQGFLQQNESPQAWTLKMKNIFLIKNHCLSLFMCKDRVSVPDSEQTES